VAKKKSTRAEPTAGLLCGFQQQVPPIQFPYPARFRWPPQNKRDHIDPQTAGLAELRHPRGCSDQSKPAVTYVPKLALFSDTWFFPEHDASQIFFVRLRPRPLTDRRSGTKLIRRPSSLLSRQGPRPSTPRFQSSQTAAKPSPPHYTTDQYLKPPSFNWSPGGRRRGRPPSRSRPQPQDPASPLVVAFLLNGPDA